jgi:hypothetical protein
VTGPAGLDASPGCLSKGMVALKLPRRVASCQRVRRHVIRARIGARIVWLIEQSSCLSPALLATIGPGRHDYRVVSA